MKTIIETSTNISKYTFEDAQDLVVTADSITCPHFIIGDMNSSNATVVEGVTPPADWMGCKYTYADSTWTVNPNYVEPEEEEMVD